jgi:predicted phage terminase large subunit-like protein
LLSTIERLDKQHRKSEKYGGGSVELPPYPGSVAKTYRLLYPKYLAAAHLKPLMSVFERAKQGEPVRVCASYPPRAGKTECVIAGITDRLIWRPESRIAYISYAGKFAQKKSARIRSLARGVGVPIDPSTRSKQDWATGFEEGGVWATSVGGQINGMGFELAVMDDLLEGREAAESVHERDRAWDFLLNDVSTRMEPDGARLLNGTRWHEDDPIGRAVAAGWEEINVPALDEHGNSYWPRRWSNSVLLQKQLELGGPDGYEWSSLYMGNPRSKGERIFQDARFADMGLPVGVARVGIGVDFAYTVKKGSDYSAAVVMAEINGLYYVIDVYRAKVSEADFRAKVAELAELYQAQFVVGYVAKTEEANVRLLQLDGLPAFSSRAVTDKKIHAMPTAAAWNLGRILCLRGKTWERPFTKEVTWFTGSDRRDDQVDALCVVYDAMSQLGAIDWEWINAAQQAAPAAFAGLQN